MPNPQSLIPNPLIHRDRRATLLWLLLCALLVACMVLVGGYTRLSGSGLSITEWKPVHGVLPPLTDAQWQEEFAGYRKSPQYEKINQGMTISEFKTIFWPEYWHRVLGRLVGFMFLLPLVIFAWRRSISRRFFWRLLGIFALGGLQGLIGWLMVKSGLVDAPYVSPVRLALHLSMALLIFACLLWAALDIMENGDVAIPSPVEGRRIFTLWFAALCLQIVLGAFMAGLHAGLIYNTWPDMNGQLVPDGLWAERPIYLNFLQNVTLIQFFHRNLAILVALGFALWWHFSGKYVTRAGINAHCATVAVILAAQFILGVFTLLHQAPLDLALAHQMIAVALFGFSVALLHRLKFGRRTA